MKLSVIIPAYNEASLLPACLDSLTKQTYPDYEVIVVDDGSTDNTTNFLKHYSPSYPYSHYRTRHQGAGGARNYAAIRAKGKILVFLDADMTASPTYLERLTAPILAGQTKGTFTKNELVGNYHNPWARCYNWEYTKTRTNRRVPSTHPSTSPVYRAILKSEFERIGGYDEIGYGEDWTLSRKLGVQAILAKDALVYHHNPDSISAVFTQARWFATRPYKLGEFGRFVGLLRASLPISLIHTFTGSIRYRSLFYLPFKLIYDLGIFLGILDFWFTHKFSQ